MSIQSLANYQIGLFLLSSAFGGLWLDFKSAIRAPLNMTNNMATAQIEGRLEVLQLQLKMTGPETDQPRFTAHSVRNVDDQQQGNGNNGIAKTIEISTISFVCCSVIHRLWPHRRLADKCGRKRPGLITAPKQLV